MTRLCELASKYGTDKVPYYTPFYDLLLARKEVHQVLEVGIGTRETMTHVPGYEPGASLRMWAEYFPDAKIVGFDRDPQMRSEGRIITVQIDERDNVDMARIANDFGEFDLIVDDASHSPADQFETCLTLVPFLSDGGMYIVEDASDIELPFPHYWVKGSEGARFIVVHG